MSTHDHNNATPALLRGVERLLDQLGAHDRAAAPFGLEETVAGATGALGRSLRALAAAEAEQVDGELESRVFQGTRAIIASASARLEGAEAAPAGLEERIFQATRATIAAAAAIEQPGVIFRLGH